MNILLAVDSSPDSKHGVEMVTHLAPPLHLHILHVVDILSLKHAYQASESTTEDFEAYRQEVSRLSEFVLHDTRDVLTSYAREIQLIADSGDPAESIIQTAEEIQADLIVLGHRGMTATPSFLLGGVSQKVATYAPCSVLICKTTVPVFDRCLLAVDGSQSSSKADDFLASGPFKSPLQTVITTVWAPPPPSGRGGTGSACPTLSPEQAGVKAKGEEALRQVVEKFKRGPYTTHMEWCYGDPPWCILESARQHHVQMIVMGARGLKGIKRFLLGSVSQKVLMHAPCAVLIVR